MPLVGVHGLFFLLPRTIKGAMAVLAVVVVAVLVVPLLLMIMHAMHIHVPLFMQGMAIAWPQWILFPFTLQVGTAKLIPWEVTDWASTISWCSWAVLGIPFGGATQRLRSPWSMLGLATIYVAAITVGLVMTCPD